MSKVVEDLAREVLNETEENLIETKNYKLYGIDPITIIICISILVNIIRVIQECKKKESLNMTQAEKTDYLTTEVKFQSMNHGWYTRRRVRNIMRKHLTKEQDKKYGEAMLKALFAVGKKTTDEQVCSLLEYK